jgi:hypothetical protein
MREVSDNIKNLVYSELNKGKPIKEILTLVSNENVNVSRATVYRLYDKYRKECTEYDDIPEEDGNINNASVDLRRKIYSPPARTAEVFQPTDITGKMYEPENKKGVPVGVAEKTAPYVIDRIAEQVQRNMEDAEIIQRLRERYAVLAHKHAYEFDEFINAATDFYAVYLEGALQRKKGITKEDFHEFVYDAAMVKIIKNLR